MAKLIIINSPIEFYNTINEDYIKIENLKNRI